MPSVELPERGFVFWPVGNGDSTTITVAEGVVAQIDINQLECSKGADDPHCPIVEELEKVLPRVGGKPYLAMFALTHPDEDHCRGFGTLLDRVKIGELWFTPRVFSEYRRDLCDDACAFKKEAQRRIKKAISDGAKLASGDRVRIIGYDELLEEAEYKGIPKGLLSVPGGIIQTLDGQDLTGIFSAFVHAPFKDDMDGERNETSLGLQVTLTHEKMHAKALLLGDLCYPTISRIFGVSKSGDIEWNVLLAPHHCSKSVMYWRDNGDKEEILKQALLNTIEGASRKPGHVVASCEPIPSKNSENDNPPHAKAKNRYEEIVPNEFLCTQEYPDCSSPEPIVFCLDEGGFALRNTEHRKKSSKDLAEAVALARGVTEPPTERVGFGSHE